MATLQRLALRGTPKATKQAARYTPAGGAERCGMCRHYVPSSSCARIEGPVSAAGWCQLYSQQVTWRPRAGQDAGLAGGAPPSLDMSFMVPGTLPPAITFTRASTGTYFDATGTLQTATTNAPRWDYDPVSHILNGLLIEEARTNLLLNSATLGTQSVTTTAVATTLSFYGTGTITKSGTATGALVGTGAAQRVSQTFTPTAGTLTLTVTGSVTNAQLEAGNSPSSYIPTTAASATRATDICTVQPLTPWFNANAGTLQSEFIIRYPPPGATQAGVLRMDDGTNANMISVGTQTAGSTLVVFGAVASVTQLNATTVPFTGNVQKVAISYGGPLWLTALGGTGYSGTGAAVPFPGVRLLIGADSQNTSLWKINGYMRRLAFWPRAMAAAELASVTA